MKSSDDQPIETLRLSDRDKAKLLWAIEESNTVSVDETKRRLRVMCSKNEAVLTLLGDNGSRTRFSVISRDLSRWGASVIHGRYVYPATRCELMVKSLDDAWRALGRGVPCPAYSGDDPQHRRAVRRTDRPQ